MQIQASPDETNKTDVLHDLPRQKPRNLAPNRSLTRHHSPLTTMEPPYAPPKSQDPGYIMATRAALSASLLDDLQNPRSPTVYRVYTCQHMPPAFPDPPHVSPGFLASPPHACHASKSVMLSSMMSSDDINKCHVSPSSSSATQLVADHQL